jgi:Fic family protein
MGRSGYFKLNHSGKLAYTSFCPSNLLPVPPIDIDVETDKLLREAYYELGKLWGLSMLVPNKSLFISMYVRKEALLSSQIEGTQATLDDIFDPNQSNTNHDVEEVIKYIDALNYADELIHTLPISNRYIKTIHGVLLSSVRGKDKEPGSFRNTQNWIGPNGSTLKNASFIPPNVTDMHEALEQLELFIHDLSDVDPLIKIALIHYQFETIHPFLDGNGRMGRLLISLLFKQYGILDDGVLYLSYYLKKNRAEYYDRLMAVRINGHYEAWIKFFIRGIIETAKHAILCMERLIDLQTTHLNLISNHDPRQNRTLMILYNYITAHPIIDIQKTALAMNRSYNTISKSVELLAKLGILQEITQKQRYRVFIYQDYLDILRDGTN